VGTDDGKVQLTVNHGGSWTDLTPLADPAPLVRAAVAFRAQHLLFPDLGGTELPDLLLAIARGDR